MEHVAFEKLPRALDQVKIRRIRGQKQEHDARILQIFGYCLGAIVAGVVADDRDARGARVGAFDLLEQGDGGDGIDGVVEAELGAHTPNIDHTIFVALEVGASPVRVDHNASATSDALRPQPSRTTALMR